MRFYTLAYAILGCVSGLAMGLGLPIGKPPSPTTVAVAFMLIAIMIWVSLIFIAFARSEHEE